MFDNKSLNNIQIFCCKKFLVLSKLLNFITKHSKNIYRKRQNSSSAIAPKLWLPTVLWKVIRVSHSKWKNQCLPSKSQVGLLGTKKTGGMISKGAKKRGNDQWRSTYFETYTIYSGVVYEEQNKKGFRCF